MDKKVVLTLGVTGQLGGLVASQLVKNDTVALRVTSRRKEELPKLSERFGSAVYMDLDDPRTFPEALKGVQCLFILTGYTVDMLVQSKALVDAAKKCGVAHIIHLGVFTPEEDCYDPHMAWHQMIEAYIKQSGISYTFLHPNCFLQNFTGMYGMAKDGKVRFYSDGKPAGWIALEDVAEATAKIMVEGESHYGKDYWFSTEVANMTDIAAIFSAVTGKKFVADDRQPSEFLKDMGADRKTVDAYMVGVEQSFVQVADGRMSYIGTARDDCPSLIGRPGMSIREWAEQHKAELMSLA